MKVLPETPLERVPGERTLFLKREDLLPYGGGNKVPRFLYALSQKGDARRVAAFSDYGCHSFTVLATMMQDPALGIDELELWELPVKPDPYRDALARRYSETPGVVVRRGTTAGLFLRYMARGLFGHRGTFRMGLGGTVRGSGASYQPAAAACARQLAEAGVEGPAVHVVPLASGDTAKAVLAALRAAGRPDDQVAGVATGPWIGRAPLSLGRPAGLQVIKRPRALSWDQYVAAARACHERTGVWLDPEHTLPAWDALGLASPDMPAVLWVTCPRIVTPPFEV